MSTPIRLNSNRAFIVGGYSHVNPAEFSDHINFFDSVSMLLQYRYRMNPSYALRDNEANLLNLPTWDEQRRATYQGDISYVTHSGLIVAELTHPSTGTGQELQSAADNGIPVIALMRGEEGKRVDITYAVRNNDHGAEEGFKLTRGVGGISKMADGNPAIIARLPYGTYSEALRKLDKVLQEKFGLVPESKKYLEAASIEEKSGNVEKASELKRKARLIDNLLEFKPEENRPKKYEKEFPHNERLPLEDVEWELKKNPSHKREPQSGEVTKHVRKTT
ncbi:MAG: hypothetical protein V1921_03860 [Candidatus Altiarchaeota archaeon]